MTQPLYAWKLSQERINSLSNLLYKLETLTNIAQPGCTTADQAARFLTDLRAQVCAAGAGDPCPDMPLYPVERKTDGKMKEWNRNTAAPRLQMAPVSYLVREVFASTTLKQLLSAKRNVDVGVQNEDEQAEPLGSDQSSC